MNQHNINISLPNLINICVDEKVGGEICGRLYHCYDEHPVEFSNVIELIREAENLFDHINIPQASTRTRCFQDKEVPPARPVCRPPKAVEPKDILAHTGKLASFVTEVRFRQNSTWQGEVTHMETGERRRFGNTLDYLKMLDQGIK